MQLPRIRTGLLRHALDNQVLIYDSSSDSVHLLDPTTACVMELLEEGWTKEGIDSEISSRLNASPIDGYFELAVAELRNAGLLIESAAPSTPLIDVTRRDILRKAAMAGAAALLIPAITTLTATPAFAQGTATLACGAICTTSSQCIGGATCAPPPTGGPTRCNAQSPLGGSCGNDAGCCSGTCSGGNPKTCLA